MFTISVKLVYILLINQLIFKEGNKYLNTAIFFLTRSNNKNTFTSLCKVFKTYWLPHAKFTHLHYDSTANKYVSRPSVSLNSVTLSLHHHLSFVCWVLKLAISGNSSIELNSNALQDPQKFFKSTFKLLQIISNLVYS